MTPALLLSEAMPGVQGSAAGVTCSTSGWQAPNPAGLLGGIRDAERSTLPGLHQPSPCGQAGISAGQQGRAHQVVLDAAMAIWCNPHECHCG